MNVKLRQGGALQTLPRRDESEFSNSFSQCYRKTDQFSALLFPEPSAITQPPQRIPLQPKTAAKGSVGY